MDAASCQGCRERDARIAELEARLAELEARVQEQARLIVDLAKKLQDRDLPKSGTAGPPDVSKPPAKKPSPRKPGGQPGHPPHLKQMLPPERVCETRVIVPAQCDRCQHTLPARRGPNDPEPTRFQVAELPEIKANIIEYQGHARTCPCCGEVTRAVIPAAVRAHSIGPGLASFMAYLVGNCGLSKRRVEEVVEAVFEVPVALGTIAKLEQEMSAALEPAHQEAAAAVKEAPIKHADETGWKKAGHKRWLWVVATTDVVFFMIHRLRNAAVARLARFCARVLKVYPALWTFVVVDGVEPTNNHAERVQRLAVLWRKNCFGCHSDTGCRFVERLLTVVQTLRVQKRSVFQYLKAALTAHRNGEPMPKLLPRR